jgi:hypothetical protein
MVGLDRRGVPHRLSRPRCKLRLAFAYDPQFTEHVFAAEQLQPARRSLRPSCGVEPLLELTSPDARAVLAETEILVTGWGPPQLDASDAGGSAAASS